MTFWLTKFTINSVTGKVIIPSHLFICMFPSRKISPFTDIIGNCVSFLQDDTYLSFYLFIFDHYGSAPEGKSDSGSCE